jgi:hypothetical protein
MEINRQKSGAANFVRTIYIEKKQISKQNTDFVEEPWLSQATTYDLNGRKIEDIYYNVDNSQRSKTAFTYDVDGKLAVKTYYKGVGVLSGKSAYTYDEQNRLIEEVLYTADGYPTERKLSAYDIEGRRVEEFSPDQSEGNSFALKGAIYTAEGARKIQSIYNAEGDLAEVLFYDASDSLISKVSFSYDAEGNLIEDAQYVGDSFFKEEEPTLAGLFSAETPFFRRVYLYDMRGNKVEENIYLAGSLGRKKTFIYDPNGNLLEEAEYEADGSLIGKVSFHREFNDQGDWVKEIVSKCDITTNEFEPVIVTYRTITYY